MFLVFWGQRGGRKHGLVRRQRWSWAPGPGATGSSGESGQGGAKLAPWREAHRAHSGSGEPESCRLAEGGKLRAGQRQAPGRRAGPGREGRRPLQEPVQREWHSDTCFPSPSPCLPVPAPGGTGQGLRQTHGIKRGFCLFSGLACSHWLPSAPARSPLLRRRQKYN